MQPWRHHLLRPLDLATPWNSGGSSGLLTAYGAFTAGPAGQASAHIHRWCSGLRRQSDCIGCATASCFCASASCCTHMSQPKCQD